MPYILQPSKPYLQPLLTNVNHNAFQYFMYYAYVTINTFTDASLFIVENEVS